MTVKKYSPDIIFENDSFVAVNKPAGLLSIPDREQSQISLKDLLLEKYGSIFTVHRLDRDTSGIIIFAKTDAAHKYFSQLFEERKIEKYYQGLVHGIPANKKGTIDAPIAEHGVQRGLYIVHRRGKPSVTDYEVIQEHKYFSLVQFQLHTGRTHQIRVHCQNIGHPLACDELYGDGKPVLLSSIKKKYKLSKHDEEERPMLNRLALHSYRLKFTDESGQVIDLEAELPKDIRALLQQLAKNK
ncbi:MAG: RluA family pseudouridine synthase [Chitinophagaceae bacterium]|nr:RluA family pseudouridine synthase [Chitinophagaceae bacterium]